METITIKGKEVVAVSPEGQKATINVEDLFKKANPRRMDTDGVVMPDGFKSAMSQGPITAWVVQFSPRRLELKWIAADSTTRYGKGTKYRMVNLALPYLILVVVFAPGENNQIQLSGFNECFFRNEPLDSLDEDELLFPALLNCSRFHSQEGNPLAWICTQHLDRRQFIAEPDLNKRMRLAYKSLLQCLLDTGFNYSSEHHEYSSWFSLSAGLDPQKKFACVDPRIATVEKWQEASEKDPLFAIEVPWHKTGMTVRQVVDRIFKNRGAHKLTMASASDVARVVFNNNAG